VCARAYTHTHKILYTHTQYARWLKFKTSVTNLRWGNCSVSLLSGCIPYLGFDGLSIHL